MNLKKGNLGIEFEMETSEDRPMDPNDPALKAIEEAARQQPDAPCTLVLSAVEWQTLWTIIHNRRPPAYGPPPTLRQAALWIGRLGGHLNRKSDGMPGIKTLWLGWRKSASTSH